MAVSSGPPDPADFSSLGSIIELIRGWLTPLFTGGILGLAYWSGRKVQGVESSQTDHSKVLARHEIEIENLRKAQNDTNIRIAELPTRTDLRDLGQMMQVQIQAAVSQIGQMLAARDRT
jgi:hypothetical protein